MARSVVVAGLVSAWARVAVAQTEPQLALSWCNGGPSQQWYYDTQNTTIVLASNGFCIDVLAYGTTPGSEVYSNPCHHDDHDPTHQNQEFSAPARSGVSATPIIETMSGLAIDAGSVLGLVSLTNASIASAFFLNVTSPANNGTGPLIHVNSGLCLDANAPSSGQPTTALTLMQCGDDQMNVERQVFSLTAVSGAVSTVFQTPYNATLCMSVDINPASGVSGLISAPCPPPSVAVPAFQGFSLDPNGHLVSAVGNEGMVAAVDASTGLYAGMPLHLDETDAAGGTVFVFNTTNSPAGPGTGRLVHATSGLCLNAGPLPNSHACLTPATRVLPFCNASLPAEARVADLISRLTLQEKIALTGSGHWPSGDSCDTIDPGVARLGIPSVQWLVETNSMVASQCYGSTCATLFPSALNLAASFNRSVWRAKGEAVSDEMRAMNNLGWHRGDTQSGTQISLNGFGPDINQPRDPRNGRIGELASEDPFLTGQYAVEYVQGMQEGEDPRYYKMTAGLKHYAGYSMETNRFGSAGNFTIFDLWDTYLPPFQAGFTAGGAAGSMCAYISLGVPTGPPYVPACANEYLLQTLVREYWGRPDAYHTSDCGAVSNMAHENHYVTNETYAAAVSINAGMDLNSNTILPDQLGLAVEMGLVNESTIDTSLSRTLAMRIRQGLLDPFESQVYTTYGLGKLGTPANRAAALEGAAQGLVLLKNDGNVLPLKAGLKIAVVGPLANAQYGLLGDYYADAVCPGASPGWSKGTYDCVPTINASITALNVGGTTVSYAGVTVSGNDTTWSQALEAAAGADVTVMVLGTDQTIAGEGTDRTDIGLPGLQAAFGAAVVAAAAGKPVVMILISSFPVSFDSLLQPVPSIVVGYAPGFGAPAIAAALFGSNRWGRAVLTVYPHAYQNAVALNDFSMAPTATNPGRSYRYYSGSAGQPLVRFGEGLTYSNVSVACNGGFVTPGGDAIQVSCGISTSSASNPAGDQVLMVYHRVSSDIIARIGASHPVPLSTLVDFQRVTVPSGVVTGLPASFTLDAPTALSLVDATGASVLYQGLHYLDVWDGGANNVTIAIEVPAAAAAADTDQRSARAGGQAGSGDRVVRRPPPMPSSL